MMNAKRFGVTLLELLVSMGILSLMLALLVPAVQRTRQSAVRLKDMNKIRQFNLAIQQYATAYAGKLPCIQYNAYPALGMESILPYLGEVGPYTDHDPPDKAGWIRRLMPAILLESDPSVYLPLHRQYYLRSGPASIVMNANVFIKSANISSNLSDGLSLTFGITEHYVFSDNYAAFFYFYQVIHTGVHQKSLGESRFASFADRDWFDARPVTTGNPPVSRCNYPGMTFQVAPTPEDATSYQVQAMDRYGLKVGMMDGSVRVVSPRVSEEVFWGAVTPAAGESVSLD